MKKSITMHYENLEYLKKHIEKLNKKATKLNCNLITIENENVFFNENELTKEVYKMISLDINFEIISIQGYKILAQLNHTYENSNIINLIDENFQIDKKYYNIEGKCEHCNVNHKRKITYLIEDENMKIKQIGKSCLKDYTGYNIENIISLVENINDIEKYIEETETNNSGDRYSKQINTIDFLNVAKMIIEEYGYISMNKAQENNTIPTKYRITEILWGNRKFMDDKQKNILEKKYEMSEKREIFEDVINALKWLEDMKNDEIDNNYILNLKTISSEEYFSEKDMGYMSSLLVAYYNAYHETKKKEEKKEEKISEFIGTIGQKIEINVTIKKIVTIEGYYGNSLLFIFEDENGNNLTWFNTSCNFDGEENEKITIKATIKEHKEYDNKNQTVLLRVKKIS